MVSSAACRICCKQAAHARAAILLLSATMNLRNSGQSSTFPFWLLHVSMKADERRRTSSFKTRWCCTWDVVSKSGKGSNSRFPPPPMYCCAAVRKRAKSPLVATRLQTRHATLRGLRRCILRRHGSVLRANLRGQSVHRHDSVAAGRAPSVLGCHLRYGLRLRFGGGALPFRGGLWLRVRNCGHLSARLGD